MTRFASIMGVAAVATLVLLSGCETPMKTDYAKDLEGVWMTTIMRDVPNQAVSPPAMVSVTTAVEATISRTDTNMGSVSPQDNQYTPGFARRSPVDDRNG